MPAMHSRTDGGVGTVPQPDLLFGPRYAHSRPLCAFHHSTGDDSFALRALAKSIYSCGCLHEYVDNYVYIYQSLSIIVFQKEFYHIGTIPLCLQISILSSRGHEY